LKVRDGDPSTALLRCGGGGRRLRIGLIAPPWVPVPPQVYGGTELVVDQLARGLVQVGCDVVLFTTGDSTCPVQRRWLYPRALGTVADPSAEVAHVERAYQELAGVDLIHDHTLSGTSADLPRLGPPVVITVHGPFTSELRDRYAAAARRASVVAISNAQRRSAPEIPVAAVIHHGIDPAGFPLGTGEGGYVLFLGRMHPDKGAHVAIAVARAAGRRILLAAKMWEPVERRYFAECVEPLLGPDAAYVGEVGGQCKLDLLAGAEALVNPIRWPEPFGLVMIEALACGTPVLSFPEGAAPEIIEHGRTGFLSTDEDDMAARVLLVRDLDRGACRASVEARFSTERMVEDHLVLYRRLLERRLTLRHRKTPGLVGDGPVLPNGHTTSAATGGGSRPADVRSRSQSRL
jgi:glycosyltransferase involved in cell wall biosynthesis